MEKQEQNTEKDKEEKNEFDDILKEMQKREEGLKPRSLQEYEM